MPIQGSLQDHNQRRLHGEADIIASRKLIILTPLHSKTRNQCMTAKDREGRLVETEMHSSPFGFPSAAAKRYFYRGEGFQRLEPGEKRSPRLIDMSSRPILNPHENDVLMGRGGKNNQHSGNERLRQIARTHCEKYRASSKKEKSNLSRQLVKQMRSLDPPARFLRRDNDSGTWDEVGDDTAREKASQVLRDAVATLSEASPSASRTASQRDSSEPQRVVSTAQHSEYIPPHFEGTPALESVASSSVVSYSLRRNKRRRYYAPQRTASDSYHPYHMETRNTPLIRRHSENIQQHNRRAEVRSSRQASLGDSSTGGSQLNEFDLLHGELLESDPEDHDEPLPPGSHRDLF